MSHPPPAPPSKPSISNHQKIHPVVADIEAPPPGTTHLFPSDISSCPDIDKADNPALSYPAPSFQCTIPATQSTLPPPRKSRQSCCRRLLCWAFLLLLFLLVLVATLAGILYLVLSPKLPNYSVDRLRVTNFTIDPILLTAHASLALTVTATNPNNHISIYYEDTSLLSVSYSSSTSSLCTGRFPAFYQGHNNVTVVDVVMSGETMLEGGMVGRLGEEERNGVVPLRFRGDVPVRVEVGRLKLWKVTSKVRCELVVSRLSAGDNVSIKTSNCKFGLKL